MGKKTALYAEHVKANAKMVDFAGWDMPLHYGSQLEEHHVVRQNAGVFDVSHMAIIDVGGNDQHAFLRKILANSIDNIMPGEALYTCMLNDKGGVIDDLIVYQMIKHSYRLIVNSATSSKDLSWLQKNAESYADVKLFPRHDDLALLAIQGPNVRSKLPVLFSKEHAQKIQLLKPFELVELNDDLVVACTGYTGEDGFEIMLPKTQVEQFWQKIIAADIAPCGLGARDTLRLEAGLNLYGADMDETTTPLEANLAWTIVWQGPEDAERQFMGRHALLEQKNKGIHQRLVGLVLLEPGVLRNHQKVIVSGIGEGEITSGSFSPTLGKGIALARVPRATTTESACLVEMRGKQVRAMVIKPPFVRHGKQVFFCNEGAET